MPVRRTHVRTLVDTLLEDHGIHDAPVDVEQLVEAHGIEMSRDKVDDDLSGFLFRDNEAKRVVIGVNASHPVTRKRFTIAHELGHYLLHQAEMVHLDQEPASYTLDFRDGKSSTGEDDNEKEANFFAAELLMPAKFLRRDLQGKRLDLLNEKDDALLEQLAEKYEVSLQALTFRLTNLHYING